MTMTFLCKFYFYSTTTKMFGGTFASQKKLYTNQNLSAKYNYLGAVDY